MIITKKPYTQHKLIKEDNVICYSIFSNFVILAIQYFILLNFDILDTDIGNKIQLLCKIIVGICFLRALPIVLRRNWRLCIITYIVSLGFYAWTFIFFPQNMIYLKEYMINFFVLCIPSYIYIYSVNDLCILKSIMRKSSYIIILVCGSLGVMVFLGKVSIGMYSMTLSYYLLFPAIVFYNEYFKRGNITNLIIAIFASILIIALGARGPLLSLFSFFVLSFIYNKKKKGLEYYIYSTLIVVCTMLLSVFFRDIVKFMYDFLFNYGIDSRTLYLLLQEHINMSGREDIYVKLFQNIILHPFLGYGLAGDIYLLDGYGFSHNFLIEVFINFGIFFGVIILFIILWNFYRGLKSETNLNVELLTIFFSIGFVHLLVSGSYLIDFKFWMFLGLMFNIRFRKIKERL